MKNANHLIINMLNFFTTLCWVNYCFETNNFNSLGFMVAYFVKIMKLEVSPLKNC